MYRIGQSTDIHRLIEGRPLLLGGILIPYAKGLLGHSDADVLLHAIAEAILGALGEGDLGKHFPDTDPRYHNLSSLVILDHAVDLMKQHHYEVNNLDATIVAQAPKLAPYIGKMREMIASHLHCEVAWVNIKAATNEGLDAIGRGEAMSATALVLLKRSD